MKTLTSFLKGLFLILLSSILVFTVSRMMPISPQQMLLSSYQLEQTPENIAMLSEKWGLDKPLYIQYFSWMKGIIRGDWGVSLISHRPIKEELMKRLPYSLSIGMGSLLLSSIFAFFLGYLAALKKGFFDGLSRFFTLFSQAVPLFVSSLFVIYFLGVKFGWIRFFTGSPWVGVIISILLISLSTCGGLSRVVRMHFLELENKSYMKRLYAHGMKKSLIYLKHGFKPVLYGLSGALIPRFSSVLGGSSVAEFIFGIPGISFFLIDSIKNRDYAAIQSYLFLIMVWMSVIHFIFRILQSRIDKRVES
ncbi:MAG: ABC transporter permease [Tissierellia bacterium]|nr:ABC transporter permease [Tissierellia bacterium]